MHAVDHQRDQVQVRQVGGEQVGQGVLGHGHEPARDRGPAGRPRLPGHRLADRLQSDRVAAGRHPGQHPLHRHLPEQLGGGEQLIGGHRYLPGPVDRADPRPDHRHSRAAQGHRPGLGAMPGRDPLRVVPAAWPARRGHVGLHQLGHHLQPGTDREGEQSLTHVGGDLVHRDAHLLGHGERPRVDDVPLVALGHGGPLLPGCLGGRPTPTARKASSGGPPPQVLRDPGQPPFSGNCSTVNNKPSAVSSPHNHPSGIRGSLNPP